MIRGIDKEIQSISIINDEILWPVQINIMSYRENSWISVKVLCGLKFPTNFDLFMLFGGFHLSTPVKWHKNNGKVCEKRSELISRHFTNDDEILSIAKFNSLGRNPGQESFVQSSLWSNCWLPIGKDATQLWSSFTFSHPAGCSFPGWLTVSHCDSGRYFHNKDFPETGFETISSTKWYILMKYKKAPGDSLDSRPMANQLTWNDTFIIGLVKKCKNQRKVSFSLETCHYW